QKMRAFASKKKLLSKRQLATWTAYVKNINVNHNKTLHQKCKSLYDYSWFVAKVRENTMAGMEVKEAVDNAVSMAIKENLLEGFFARHRAEVIEMILTEFDEEVFKQNVREDGYLEGLEAGRTEGLAQGASQKAIEAAENLLMLNALSYEQISQAIGLPIEKVQELAQCIMHNS
ncbi:MAG: Rpn family recombination-promoting nuclease/putative transposase, partial [Treponema sp.]|nr:Rpn family recombination-promoting nuclease/putative transposase [Treponema sp.]